MLNRMPRIWQMYLAALLEQRLVTRARCAFDHALRTLPVTQHHRVWPLYLRLAVLPSCPAETSIRIYRRFLQFDPSCADELVELLVSARRLPKAADHIVLVLNDGSDVSDNDRALLLKLCDLLAKHADEIAGLKMEAFPDGAGRLRALLAECYACTGLNDKARDVLEEGVTTAATAAEFALVFEAYAQLEQSLVTAKMEKTADEEGDRLVTGCWLADSDDSDMCLARQERLLDRRPELLNGVLLRQNPHDVAQWHRRVKLFDKDPARQAATYVEADHRSPAKATGKPHTLWVAFAKMYKAHGCLDSADEVFAKAMQVSHRSADDLATVWCEWAEMKLLHKRFDKAVSLMRQATAEPSAELERRAGAEDDEPAQLKLHKFAKMWSFYVDLEESLGTLASTCAAYEGTMGARAATPQMVINYASFLEEHGYFEDSFAANETGAKLFGHPHSKPIWETYLERFMARHGRSKPERARELFAEAIGRAPPHGKKLLFLRHARYEEEFGSAARAMSVYDEAARSVPASDITSIYEAYAARAAELCGVLKVRQVYEQAIESSGLPRRDALAMCLRLAALEEALGEAARARAVFVHASGYADLDADEEFWTKWSSFELWHDYLLERTAAARAKPPFGEHPANESLNRAFERALAMLNRMPRIWQMYLAALLEQRLVTRARCAFDHALRTLPVTQHHRVWPLYLRLAVLPSCPAETSIRIYRRFLQFDPSCADELVELLVSARRLPKAADHIVLVLNDGSDVSDNDRALLLKLCDLLAKHADEIAGLKMEAFPDGAGRLRALLAECYACTGLNDKARDVLEEGVTTAATAAEFALVFEAYAQLEQSLVTAKMEKTADEEGDRLVTGCWLADSDDSDMCLARQERLLDRRPELLNGVLLRQNPHDVAQWHRRVKLFDKDPARQAATYVEADHRSPAKATGKPHTLWVAFAKMYKAHGCLDSADEVFAKAMQVSHRSADDLATVWCEWAEMKLLHKRFDKAVSLMRQATAEPSAELERRAGAEDDEPAQLKLHKFAKMWSFYVDLEESLGTLASTCAAYEGTMGARAATPQMVINYASFLEEHGYFEDSFAANETGAKLFGHPHSKPIWETYLERFMARHGRSKPERARELFAEAIGRAPPHGKKLLFLRHARYEEEFGSAARAMSVYDEAARSVPASDITSIYEAYAARAAELCGVLKVRQVYEQAIESSGLPRRDALAMCLRLAALEEALGEAARARAVFVHASGYADLDADEEFWTKWSSFEVRHGDEDSFTDMLRIKHTQKHAKPPGFDAHGELKDEKKRCADQLGAPHSKRQRVEKN
uniref:Suppressor of forked domain-containing protein n=1 Tax=Oryza punctata TaxID=4537 RepID=A0A0E0JMK7_ORYPU